MKAIRLMNIECARRVAMTLYAIHVSARWIPISFVAHLRDRAIDLRFN